MSPFRESAAKRKEFIDKRLLFEFVWKSNITEKLLTTSEKCLQTTKN